MKSRLISLAAVCAFFAAVTPASAQSLEMAPQKTLPPDQPKKLEWNHPRFSTVEYVATGSLLAGLGAATALMKDEAPKWKGGVLMDDSMKSFGRAGTVEGRRSAARASDYLLYGLMVWPYLDAGVALARNNPDVAWQMSLINTEAQALTGLLTFLVKRTVLRERPYVAESCAGSSDPKCGSSASFLSGHSSHAFTGAGLVCAHHSALPLYGSKIADISACATALAAATVTASLRVIADVHYTSDVFAGATLGLLSGWLMPKLIHYGGFSGSTETAKVKKTPGSLVGWSAMPIATPGGAMLMVNGVTF